MFKRMSLLFVAALSFSGLIGCSDNPVVEKWSISTTNDALSVNALFDPSYVINGEALIPFKKYGNIHISQTSNEQTNISINLALAGLLDNSLSSVSALPTGAPFPTIVRGSMLAIKLMDEPKKWDGTLYVSFQDEPDGTKRRLVGFGIGFRGISNSIGDVTLTQNFFTDAKQKFAAVTFYGPKIDPGTGKELVPGGLFVVGDINFLIDSSSPMKLYDIEMGGDVARYCPTIAGCQKVADEMLQSLVEAGILKKR